MKTITVLTLIGTALVADARGQGFDTTPAVEAIRTAAKQVIQPLPEKMPGRDKDTPALVELGKKLFFEKRLSANESQSCNSCHHVDAGRAGVDNEPTSPGAFGKRGDRNSPTVLNAGFHFAQFWDGRAATLEHQAKGPILNPGEMAMPNEGEAVARLKNLEEYASLFKSAFPGADNAVTYENIACAIAAFERTLVTQDRLDDFLKGDDRALSSDELKGLNHFLTLGCTACHNGPLLGGNTFQKMGLIKPYDNKRDRGRFEVTKNDDDQFKFKVPSLRNVALTAPYFHDGAAATLDDAVTRMALLQLGRELSMEERTFLIAFLRSLSDKERAKG